MAYKRNETLSRINTRRENTANLLQDNYIYISHLDEGLQF